MSFVSSECEQIVKQSNLWHGELRPSGWTRRRLGQQSAAQSMVDQLLELASLSDSKSLAGTRRTRRGHAAPLHSKSVDAQSVVDRAYADLVDRIAIGAYRAGEHLSEIKLTKDLKASRGSVREAIRRLHADGVVDVIANRGASVRKLTYDELAEHFQLRGLYEAYAARRAAERIEESGHRLRVALLTQEVENLLAGHDIPDFSTHNYVFHRTLIDLAGNRLLAKEWERLRSGRLRLRHLRDVPKDHKILSLHQHRDILSAIAEGDADRAAQIGGDHVYASRIRIQRLSPSQFDEMFNGVTVHPAAADDA